MRKGDVAKLKMQKMLCADGQKVADVHECFVLQYDAEQENIYLALQNGTLTNLSLDGVYKCEIQRDEESVACTGRIQERYCSGPYKILKFRIENGFYKINIKCVDKQKT